MSNAALGEIRNSLLQPTIERAAGCGFYGRLWAGADVRIRRTADLARLPFLRKEHLRDHAAEMFAEPGMSDFVLLTGGTLQLPTLLHRTHQESLSWAGRNSLLSGMLTSPLKPLCLNIQVPTNGSRFFVPGSPVLNVPLVLAKHFEFIDQLLQKSFQYAGYEARISTIMSGQDRLKILTAWLLETGIQATRYSVQNLITSASFQTLRWRKLFESTWGARVTDVYGLSEVPGATALQCDVCGGYHFDPCCVPEVVDLFQQEPIDSGIGSLVLTALYPFVQQQPIIRYWTDDLVAVDRSCPIVDDLRIEFLGRRSQCIFDEDGTCLLEPTSVVDALDSIPEVAIQPDPLITGLASQDVGYHRWKASLEHTPSKRLVLQVELRYEPLLYEERVQLLRLDLASRLKSRSRRLSDAMANDLQLEVEFVRPGTLPAVIV